MRKILDSSQNFKGSLLYCSRRQVYPIVWKKTLELGNVKMSGRYKGWQNAASIKRDFPYVVELQVPPGGFGTRLDRIYGFHTRLGVNPRRGRGRREGEHDIVCWRFADAEIAQAFADEFGGVMLFPTSIL